MTDLLVDAGVAPREKFTTIYSGMDVQPFLQANEHRESTRRQFGFSAEHIVFGKVARLFHLKGHDDLLIAAQRVVRSCPQVRFLLVGDGELRESLTQQISQAGLTDSFRFAGLVDPAAVPAMIGALDALVHVSLREGLARSLPQALIAGKPVVSYDIDGAREVVLPNETGFLVPPRDTEKLADAMVQLAVDADLRQRLGETGRRRFADQFRHEVMTEKIRAVYQRVLREGVRVSGEW
jgi:glycosyltransferase involved in cell wall biosynthesis